MRKLVLSLVAGAAMAAASAASATSFVASTQGCFSTTPCVFGNTVSITGTPQNLGDTGAVLTFNSGSFNVTDSNGLAPIGGSGAPGTNTLGTFSMTGGTGTSSFNTPFSLLVTFTQPGSVSGTNTFASVITGSATGTSGGGVEVLFDNTPHLFTSDAGPFSLLVKNLSVTNGDMNTPITGTIRAVPEPATWAMMLVGFAGIGFAMRRRRQPALAQVA